MWRGRLPGFATAAAFTLFVCLALAVGLHLPPTSWAQYSAHQAAAFLHGRMDLEGFTPWSHDLSFYDGKIYSYWPPLTAVMMLPAVALTGPVNFPQRWFAMLLGALNAGLYFLIFDGLAHRAPKAVPRGRLAALSLALGAGSSNLVFAVVAAQWFVAQLCASTMALAGLALILAPRRGPGRALAAMTAFGLAIAGRPELILSLPLWLYLSFSSDALLFPEAPRAGWRALAGRLIQPRTWPRAAALLAPVALSLGLMAWMNVARFGRPTEFGLAYHHMASRFVEPMEEYGFMNLHYLPHNVYVTLLRLPWSGRWDGLDASEGFSLLLQTPVFLLLFGRAVDWAPRPVRSLALWSVAAVMLFTLCLMATGWVQFGARYLYDAAPFAAVALFLSRPVENDRLVWALAALSVAINIAGAVWLTPLI